MSKISNEGTAPIRIHAIDTGQGESFLLEGSTGDTILIDSGHHNDEGESVLNYLDEHNIDHLDHLVATHFDADHIGGHTAIVEAFGHDGIGEVHGPDMSSVEWPDSNTVDRFEKALEKNGINPSTLQEESNALAIDGVAIDVLNPSAEVDSSDRNENSVVIQATHGEHSVLLPADIEATTTQRVVDEYSEQLDAVDVLVPPHHGAENPAWRELLEASDPDAVCFSYDENNSNDHPHDAMLDETRDADVTADIYAIPLHGATVMTLDGRGDIAVEATADRDALSADDLKLAKYYEQDLDRLALDGTIPYTDLSDNTPYELVDHSAVVKPRAQQLHNRLDTIPTENEQLADEMERTRDLIDSTDPWSEAYDQQLDLFEDQVDQLEAQASTDQSTQIETARTLAEREQRIAEREQQLHEQAQHPDDREDRRDVQNRLDAMERKIQQLEETVLELEDDKRTLRDENQQGTEHEREATQLTDESQSTDTDDQSETATESTDDTPTAKEQFMDGRSRNPKDSPYGRIGLQSPDAGNGAATANKHDATEDEEDQSDSDDRSRRRSR